MTHVWGQAALWLGLALLATLFSIWFRVATALCEIVVGTVARLVIGALVGTAALGAAESWTRFLSGTGSIVLTFLAGAELDPAVFRAKWKEATGLGLVAAAGVPLETKIVVGHPAEQVVQAAADQEADLIVMGHRGKTRIREWLLGSVAKRVMSYAPCSVTIVR